MTAPQLMDTYMNAETCSTGAKEVTISLQTIVAEKFGFGKQPVVCLQCIVLRDH